MAALDCTGNTILAGSFSGTVDFGAGPVSSGDADLSTNGIFVVKLDLAGQLVFVRTYPAPGDQTPVAVTVDPAGNILLAARMWCAPSDPVAVDFGGGDLGLSWVERRLRGDSALDR